MRIVAERNIETAQAYFGALNNRDFDGAVAPLASEVVADFSRSLNPDMKGVWRGREEVKALFERLADAWGEYELFAEEYLALGEQVLRVGGLRARGAGSGIEVVARAALLWTFRHGEPVRLEFFQSKEEALAAAAEGE